MQSIIGPALLRIPVLILISSQVIAQDSAALRLTKELGLRRSPHLDAEIVSTIPANTTVEPEKFTHGFWLVKYTGVEGYVIETGIEELNSAAAELKVSGQEADRKDVAWSPYINQAEYVQGLRKKSRPYALRRVKWGMGRAEIISAEGRQPDYNDVSYVGFDEKMAGHPATLAYYFAEEKVVAAAIVFNQEHANKTLFISDYLGVKEILTDKYGKPYFDEHVWRNDLYKDDPEDWGLAISIGHLSYETAWDDGDTLMNLSLTGDNYDISMMIMYRSNELGHLLERESRKAAADEF